ncbi:MAG: zinc-binding dehydrogenase [Phycisphaera sp.]|nr:zinc-binding dehydrogenase [Phycisphaera sp.]
MKAAVLNEVGKTLEIEERDAPKPGAGEVVVALKAAALNRRDFWITQGLYPGVKCPVVLGSDGAGVVSAVGEGVDAAMVGREVVIDPGLDWGDDERAQAEAFHILGMPRDGTFAEAVVVPAGNVHDKPGRLSWAEAAALPLGGVTAFRAAIVQGAAGHGRRVLVTGVGGGVATFAVQFAHAVGSTVFVTSSSEAKIDAAIRLGATAGYDYTADGWAKRLVDEHGPMDVIIDSAGGAGYNQLLDACAPGGAIVNYGSTAGPPAKLDMFKVFWKQLRLQGTTMGSPADFAAMLHDVNAHAIRPVIDRVMPLAEADAAVALMKGSPQFGKIVLEIAA